MECLFLSCIGEDALMQVRDCCSNQGCICIDDQQQQGRVDICGYSIIILCILKD